MLTVPLKAMPELAHLAPLLVGKVVLDTGNAYERRDGDVALQASQHPQGSAAWAAAMFPGSRWVKAFNTVYFKTLERPGRDPSATQTWTTQVIDVRHDDRCRAPVHRAA